MLILLFLLPTPTLAVLGGTPVDEPYPFYVRIMTNGLFICGGTIIDTDSVLTAARCIYDYANKRVFQVKASTTQECKIGETFFI